MISYVYVITDGIGNCKIGKANNVKSRLRGLQTANSNKLRIKYKHPCKNQSRAKLLESLVHEKLKKYNTNGEWFSVSANTAKETIKATAKEYSGFTIQGKRQKSQKRKCLKSVDPLYDIDIREMAKNTQLDKPIDVENVLETEGLY